MTRSPRGVRAALVGVTATLLTASALVATSGAAYADVPALIPHPGTAIWADSPDGLLCSWFGHGCLDASAPVPASPATFTSSHQGSVAAVRVVGNFTEIIYGPDRTTGWVRTNDLNVTSPASSG